MDVQVSFQATLINPLNNFVVAWALNSSPSTIINTIVPAKPYGSPWQVTIPGLTPNQLYIITLWESAGTTPTGTNRNSAQYQPVSTITTTRTDEYLTADITPGLVSNTNTYINTSYAGWGYSVERVPGTMYPQGAPNVIDPDYDQDTAGGFHLVRPGDTFGANEKFVVRFLPQVAPAVAGSTGAISSGIIINAARSLDNTYLNQAIFLQGSGSSLPITLPPLSSVSDYQYVYFFSAGGIHISAPILCAGSDKIQFNSNQVTQIILCQSERLKLFKANGVWNIDAASPSIYMAGEIIYKYTKTDFNYVLANGALLSRTAYARLYAYMNTLEVAAICSEAVWMHTLLSDGINYNDNNGKWTQGDGSTTFRVPMLLSSGASGVGFLRGIDGSGRMPGSLQIDALQDHQHDTVTNGNNSPFNAFGAGPTKNVGGFNGIINVPSSLTGNPGVRVSGMYQDSQRKSYETRSQNIGVYALLRI